MANVEDVRINPITKEGGRWEGELLGYSISAQVEVGGEEGVYEFTTEDPELRSLVDQLFARIHAEAVRQSAPRLQEVLDAEAAFEE